MSYNEIPNILVVVVLPNKPLSNIEIIDVAKRLSLYGFRGVFLQDTLPKKAILNEWWYFKFRYIVWWRYTLSYVVQKR